MSLSSRSTDLPLSDLVQVSALGRRSFAVRVQSPEGTGQLCVQHGRIHHATYGSLTGNEAAYAILAASDLAYDVTPLARVPEQNVTLETQHLLLESARLNDEGALPRPSVRSTMASATPSLTSTATRVRPVTLVLLVASLFIATILMVVLRKPDWASLSSQAELGVKDLQTENSLPSNAPLEAGELTGVGDAPPTLRRGGPPRAPKIDVALLPTIVCRLLVDTSGRVIESKIYRSRLNLEPFEDAALDAVRGYEFNPAQKGGRAVAAWVNWPVTFTRATPSATLHIKGSDTIGGALGPDLAAAYERLNGNVEVEVEALGTATAFAGLIDGSADIGAASRPAEERELREAEAVGIELLEVVIGYDGIAVIVHPKNPVAALSLQVASRVFSGAITRWDQLPGGFSGRIRLVSRPSSSGTYGYFETTVLRLGNKDGPQRFATWAEYVEKSEDIVNIVAQDPSAIAYVGLGWVKSAVKPLALSMGEGLAGKSPTAQSVRDGSYPVYRPLLMYARRPASPLVLDFLRFALSPDARALVAKHGFVPSDLSADAMLPSELDLQAAGQSAAAEVIRIPFRRGSSYLDAEQHKTLAQVAARLRSGRWRALIIGNADSAGQESTNASLALLRAQSVGAWLENTGVSHDVLSVESAGATTPLATNSTLEGREQNRRVDVLLRPR